MQPNSQTHEKPTLGVGIVQFCWVSEFLPFKFVVIFILPFLFCFVSYRSCYPFPFIKFGDIWHYMNAKQSQMCSQKLKIWNIELYMINNKVILVIV